MDRDVRLDVVNAAVIRGRLVVMRAMGSEEAQAMYPWTLDPDVNRFWGADESYRDREAFLARLESGLPFFDGSRLELGRCFAI